MKPFLRPSPFGPYSESQLQMLGRSLTLPDLTVPFRGSRRDVPAYRIVRLEADGNYTKLHFCDGTMLLMSLTLKRLESRLPPELFVRPHKSNIINLLYLDEIRTDKCLLVSLTNGDVVEVSRRKTTRFLKQIQSFQRQLGEQDLRYAIRKPELVAAQKIGSGAH